MVDGVEKRRVRFSSIQGMTRDDLPLAAEVWQSDIIGQIWTSREVLKLSVLLAKYMREADEQIVSASNIERVCSMDVAQTRDTLRQMQMFGAVEAFSFKDSYLHASLCLTLLQRIRVLELRERLIELGGSTSMHAIIDQDEVSRWSPPPSDVKAQAEQQEPSIQLVAG